MMANAVVTGSAILALGGAAGLVLRKLPSLRLQLAALALVAVTLPLGSVLVSGAVMLDLGSSIEFVAVALAAGAVSLAGAILISGDISRRIDRVRVASVRLATGDLSERAPVGGPTEVAQLASSFNTMADHLEEVVGARRELVAWASHDLRAPVASLQAVLEAIEDGIVEPGEYTAVLHRQVQLLSSMIDDLFQLACIDAGAMALDLVAVDLGGVAERCAALFDMQARVAGCSLTVAVAAGTPVARCTADQVARVLANLVANALSHTPTGGSVVVSVARTADAVRVSVRDTGSGIDPTLAERVFEPFFRADPARTPASGNAGLGLAIARGLIEAQGGRIWADAAAEGGACMHFVLPAAPVPTPVVPAAVGAATLGAAAVGATAVGATAVGARTPAQLVLTTSGPAAAD